MLLGADDHESSSNFRRIVLSKGVCVWLPIVKNLWSGSGRQRNCSHCGFLVFVVVGGAGGAGGYKSMLREVYALVSTAGADSTFVAAPADAFLPLPLPLTGPKGCATRA